jgi:hypothetical protein
MSFVRVGPLVFVFFLALPSWGKQASQSSSTTQPNSDPQAVAVVQAAITALGGAVAISQAQSWTFHAQMTGPITNDNVNYTITTQMPPAQQVTTRRGTIKRIPMVQSYFVPALIGKVLVKELQDAEFSISYMGSVTVNSKPCAAVAFSVSSVPVTPPTDADQIWCFDSSTNLPVQVEFRLPAELGASMSPTGVVYFADYRFVSGVMYPYFIGIPGQGGLPEIIIILSVAPSVSAVSPEFNGAAGDIGR